MAFHFLTGRPLDSFFGSVQERRSKLGPGHGLAARCALPAGLEHGAARKQGITMRHATLAALAAALVLGACSQSAPPPSPATAQAPSAVPSANPKADLPQPDRSTPDQTYVLMETPVQVLALESALSNKPKYELMAQVTSSDYGATRDTFKKRDLLTALQPKLDASISDAKGHRYIVWISPFPQIGHYDIGAQIFPVGSGLFQPDGASQFFQDGQPYARITVANGAVFKTLHVTDESKARVIEDLVPKVGGLRLKVYAFAQGTDDSGTPTVQTTITKVEVLDPQDHVLFEQAAP